MFHFKSVQKLILTFLLGVWIIPTMPVFAQKTADATAKVIEKGSGIPVSWVQLIVNDTLHILSDERGRVDWSQLPYPIGDSLDLRLVHPLFGHLDTVIVHKNTAPVFEMDQYQYFEPILLKDPEANIVMNRVISRYNDFHPANWDLLNYKTYTKLVVGTKDIHQFKTQLSDILDKVTPFKKSDSLLNVLEDRDHHVFLMETASQREYRNEFNSEEKILTSNITGIDDPSIFALTSIIQPFSAYNRHIVFMGTNYYSPFSKYSQKWYHYQYFDVFESQDGGLYYVIRFNAQSLNNASFLKGFFLIDAFDFTIKYLYALPSLDSESSKSGFVQEYSFFQDSLLFPSYTNTFMYMNRFDNDIKRLDFSVKTNYYDRKIKPKTKGRYYSDLIINFDGVEKGMPDSLRIEPLTENDKATFAFYDSVGSIKEIENYIRLAEGIYYGEIPYKDFNIQMNKVFYLNGYESVRLGMGGRTNDLFSKRFRVNGYASVGMRDLRWKYGLGAAYILDPLDQAKIGFDFTDDIVESGGTEFFKDDLLFSSEKIRKYEISQIDYKKRTKLYFEGKPLKYTWVTGKVEGGTYMPAYTYSFYDQQNSEYKYFEWMLGIKIAYGESRIKALEQFFVLPSEFPSMWLQFSKGYANDAWGDYDYERIDFKVQSLFNALGWGKSSVQLHAGLVSGDLPAPFLYNGKGSYRSFSAIIHNSFETMYFNEFLINRHISFFYSHNFGDIYIRQFKKQPSIVFSHNMGVGWLDNADAHNLIINGKPVKSMEKGYYETGLWLNNILTFKAFAFSVSLGAGVFGRYGPYAHNTPSENLLWKLAIQFGL